MKILQLIFCLLLTQAAFCQEWNTEELNILNKYGIQTNDPRGIVFVKSTNSECIKTYESVQEAIEAFFLSELKSDLITLCIKVENNPIYFGEPLGIKRIVEIYLNK